MNILVLVADFYPHTGSGVAKSVLSEVRELASRGHHVAVLTRRTSDTLCPHEVIDGYEIYRYHIPPRNSLPFWANPLWTLLRVPRVVRRLQERFDLVYATNPYQAVGVLRANPAMPIVYSFYFPMHEDMQIESKHGKFKGFGPLVNLISVFVKRLEHRAIRGAHTVLARSQFMRDQLESLYRFPQDERDIRVVPIGVDTDVFQFCSDTEPHREKLALPPESRVLLTVRRLTGRMGLENLIDAMKAVGRTHSNALLLIGGIGYLEDTLRERVRANGLQQQVRLIGFIPEEKLPNYYQAAELSVLPTMELEGFGLSTIEALSCGTPVMATPVGANPEVLGPLGSEFLCKDATAEGIAEGIDWWLNRPISQEIRRACRKYCVSKFAIASVVASLENVFAEATKPGGSK